MIKLILIYHSVNDNEEFVPFRSVNLNLFEKQMRFLSKNLKVGSIYDYLNGKCGVSITFDDGYKNNYTNAYPILKKYNLSATFFVTTGLIGSGKIKWDDKIASVIQNTTLKRLSILNKEYVLDNKMDVIDELIAFLNKKDEEFKQRIVREIINQLGDSKQNIMMSWYNIKEMSENNMFFGSHSVSHCNLAKVSLQDAEKEIALSKKAIEEKIKKKVDLFSYPYGGIADFNEDILKLLRKHGFICGLLNGCSSNDGFSLARYGAPQNLFLFKLKMKHPRFYEKIRNFL